MFLIGKFMNTQTCNKCGLDKPFDAYGYNKKPEVSIKYRTNFVGVRKTCLQCEAERAKEFRKKFKNYRGSGKLKNIPENHRYIMSAIRCKVSEAKTNNKRKNRPFDIDAEYVYSLWLKQENKCVYTGETFKVEKNHPANISIDKIVPDLGYTKGNIQLVCWAVNRAKGDLPHKTFLEMCKVIHQRATTSENTNK